MRKFLIIFLICLSIGCGGITFAQSQFAPLISKMEKSVLGMNYTSQNDEQRLARLEKSVYGQALSGSVSQRVNKLSADVNADVMGQEIAPKRDTFENPEDSIKEDIPKADKNVNYPSINSLEDKIFSKEFKGLDVNQRLSNLEKNVFKKSYSDDLNSRVERLQSAIAPQTVARDDNNDNYYSDDSGNLGYGKGDFGGYSTGMAAPQNFGQNNYYSPPQKDLLSQSMEDSTSGGEYEENGTFSKVKIASIEKSVLKHSYPNDNLYNRLARLETTMFGTVFGQDDAQTRIERIASAYKAEKSAKKYDGNKLSQHFGTAAQLGAILLMVLAFVL